MSTAVNLRSVFDGVSGDVRSATIERIAETHKQRRELVKRQGYQFLADPKRRKAVELAKLIKEAAQGGHLAMGRLREAVSSGDFPLLFQSISQAALLGQYAELPQQWPLFSQRTTVPDFRPARLVRWTAGLDQLVDANGGAVRHVRALPRIPELTEYPTFNLSTEGMDYFVNKYGARFPFSWEAFMNDELRVLQELPAEMARWARDTEDVLTTGVFATASGPNPDFFDTVSDFGTQVGHGNFIRGRASADGQADTPLPDNPPLSIAALEWAIMQVGMRMINNRLVRVQEFVLLVPPSLALTAHELSQATTYLKVYRDSSTTTGGATSYGSETRMNVVSPISGRFTVVESPWLPLIDRSPTAASTWYLIPAGGMTERGPAVVTAFLRGHDAPEVRVMGDTGTGLGGEDISAFEGSFSHDDIQYRVRSIIGAAGLDHSAVACSLGNAQSIPA